MRRRSALTVLAALTALLAACSDDAPSVLSPNGDEAHRLAGVSWLLFGLGALVYVVVAGLVVAALTRGRRAERPSRWPAGRWIVVGGIAVPAVVLALLAVVTVDATADLRRAADDELVIEVVGKRWWWEVRYPDAGVVTANEVHVPVGEPVRIDLVSDNISHSFWVPELAGKVDLVPGQPNQLRVTADGPGEHLGMCAEYCGIQHANMRFLVVAEPRADFDRWLDEQAADAAEPSGARATRGRDLVVSSSCGGCHTVRGTTATGRLGPDLTHVASRARLGAGVADADRAGFLEWVGDPHDPKPGVLMPDVPLTDDQLDAVVAYLLELR